MWNSLKLWFESKGGFAHWVAGLFASAVIAYAAVPAFAALVNNVYAFMPSWAHQVALALIGLYTWYTNTSKKVVNG